jgi:hypothetical protein
LHPTLTTVLTTTWAAFSGKRRLHHRRETQRFRLFKPHIRRWRHRATHTYRSSRKSARSGDELLEPSRYGVATIPSANVWRSPAPYPLRPSRFFDMLTGAVLESGRWEKWLQPDEPEDFDQLSAERRHWLVTSGARYVWTDPRVIEARSLLYDNLTSVMTDPDGWVVERIATSIERYVRAFNLFGSAGLLATNAADKGT